MLSIWNNFPQEFLRSAFFSNGRLCYALIAAIVIYLSVKRGIFSSKEWKRGFTKNLFPSLLSRCCYLGCTSLILTCKSASLDVFTREEISVLTGSDGNFTLQLARKITYKKGLSYSIGFLSLFNKEEEPKRLKL